VRVQEGRILVLWCVLYVCYEYEYVSRYVSLIMLVGICVCMYVSLQMCYEYGCYELTYIYIHRYIHTRIYTYTHIYILA
jgi:hypothetical protein